MGGIYEGFDGYEIYSERELKLHDLEENPRRTTRAIWNRREKARVWYRAMRRNLTYRQRLAAVGRMLCVSYDLDVDLCRRLSKVEQWRQRQVRRLNAETETDLLAWYVDRFPRFGRYAGVPDAKDRLQRLMYQFKVRMLKDVKKGIRLTEEARKAWLRGERAERKRMEREAGMVRISLQTALEDAWERIRNGRRADHCRDTIRTVERQQRALEVALGG